MVIINSFKYPESQIIHEEKNVRIVLDNKDIGVGTLYVSEYSLCWHEKDNVGFSIGYGDISLHAICRDTNVFPRDCLYVIIDNHFYLAGQGRLSNSSSDSDCDSSPNISEIIVVPEEPPKVVTLYEALKICQELNPDKDDMDEDDAEDQDDNASGDGQFIDVDEGSDEGVYHLAAGDAVDELSRRLQNNSVDVRINYANGDGRSNGHVNDEEFEDAD